MLVSIGFVLPGVAASKLHQDIYAGMVEMHKGAGPLAEAVS